MGDLLNNPIATGILRSVIINAAGFLVADGVLTAGQLQIAVGAIITLVALIWSIISNRQKMQAVAVVKAVQAHPSITLIPAAQSPTGKPIVRVAPMPASTPGGLATTFS